jgi:hypothetical protein
MLMIFWGSLVGDGWDAKGLASSNAKDTPELRTVNLI